LLNIWPRPRSELGPWFSFEALAARGTRQGAGLDGTMQANHTPALTLAAAFAVSKSDGSQSNLHTFPVSDP